MFGDRLKALRNEKDMTQQQMVDAIIARLIERGYNKEDAALSLGTYRKLLQQKKPPDLSQGAYIDTGA